MRGNRGRFFFTSSFTRSIPACAGEPAAGVKTPPALRVYPRVCGGTWKALAPLILIDGLSPRVRGNRKISAAESASPGSIPACAGEPRRRNADYQILEVYPRVCGGTKRMIEGAWSHGGLSPRVRGNLLSPAPLRGVKGSIPACAGEPIRRSVPRLTAQVYPRVCGGTGRVPQLDSSFIGLSPRVRGNPLH